MTRSPRTSSSARRLVLFTVALISLLSAVIGLVPITADAETGDFSLDMAAAAPYSYNHLTGGGAFDDGTIGKRKDVVESLEASDFACGDIVTYFTKITVDDTAQAAADAPQTIELDYEFLMDTTGQPGVAIGDIVHVGVNYGTIQDLIAGEDSTDSGNLDDGGSVATLISETQTAPMFSKGAKLQGTIQVTDLEWGETVIVRIDTKLFCQPGADPTGNLQADLTAARLTYVNGTVPVTPPGAISAGNQTIPFYQFGELNVPEINLAKTVTTAGGTCPGTESLTVTAGTQVKYCYVVTNPSSTTNPPGAPLYNVTLVDDNGTPANAADDFPVTLTGLTDVDLDGTADDLAAGGTATGSALRTMSAVGTIVNTGTATGYDSITFPTAFTDTDTASVTVNPPPPVAPVTRVIKGNAEGNDTVATLDEPGGSVTINVVVYNDAAAGVGDATLTSLTDDVYGNITTTGHNGITATTCATGGVIAGGSSYSCSFTVSITSGPATIVDTVTATLQNAHSTVSDTDQANVVISNVVPTIEVTKTANPTSVPETGGDVTFTFTVKNTSAEFVTITTLTDSVYGTLDGGADCMVGTVLAAGASCEFSITRWVEGDFIGADHVNVFTAKAVDNDNTEATDTDDATVDFTNVLPMIEVTKTSNPTAVPETGGDVAFTFVVKNTSTEEPVTITSLSDSVFGVLDGDADCKVGTVLAAGASCTFSITKWVEGDFSGPDHVNVFTAKAVDNDNTEATDTDDATVDFTNVVPTIEVTKTPSVASVPETGGDVTFTFVVKNTSTEEPVTITSLSDSVYGALDGDADCKVGTVLAAGASCAFSITRLVTGDYTGPDHVNVFTAKAVDNDNTEATDTDDATVDFTDVAPVIEITKTANPTHVPETGANVTFTFVVKNLGPEPVTLTTLNDTRFGNLDAKGTCDVPQTIAVGGSYSCTYTVFLASDSLAAHTNVVTATAVDDDGTPATDTDDETVTFDDVAPAVRITKTAAPTHVPETGGNVTFTFLVENIGVEDVTLTSLTDTVFGNLDGKGTCDVPQAIAVGGSYSCTYTVFLGSDSLASHTNVVTATAVDDDNTPATDDDDEVVTFDDVKPDISVTKTANPTHVPETGANVTFTYVVTNNSAESASITVLSDDRFGALAGDADCKVGTLLAAGASCSFAATFAVPAGDVPGSHVDVFTATAVDNDGNSDTATDDATVVYTDVLPDISVTKSANPTSVPETGGNVTFTYVVTNNSAEAASITVLSDDRFGALAGDADCKVGTVLAAGASCGFSITRWVEGDFSGPDHVNVFTATASDGDGNTDTATDDATVDFTNVLPMIEVTKTPSVASVPETGGNVTFTFVVKNTSSEEPVTITVLSDSVYGVLDGDADCKVGTILAAGASCEFSITKWVEGDFSGPDHVNVFTAKAVDNENTEATDTDDATVDFTNVLPAIEVTKTANPTAVPETGGDVTFTYVVKNTSTEEPVAITSLGDSVFGALLGDADCKVGTVLAAGASCEFSITKWVEGEYSGPDHVNVFTAKAVDNDNSEATDTDDATVDFTDVVPVIRITKTAEPTQVSEIGGTVTFTILVENIGEEDVTLTELTDSKFGNLDGKGTCDLPQTILIDESYSCSFTVTLSSDSLAAHTNVVTAVAEDDDGTEATDDDDATVTFKDELPAIDIVKTANPTTVHLGDPVTYTYAVRNLGVEAIAKVTVSDDKCSPLAFTGGDTDGDGKLDVSETWTYSCTTTLTGTTTNVATAVGEDNDGNKVTDTDTKTVNVINPAIVIVKEPSDDSVSVGDPVTFTYTVTNPGNDALANVVVTDDRCSPVRPVGGDADSDGKLDPGESWTFTCTTTMTQPGSITNIGTVTANDVLGDVVSATDTATVGVLEVLGVVIQRPLPRTGAYVLRWAMVSAVLILLGAAMTVPARRRRTA